MAVNPEVVKYIMRRSRRVYKLLKGVKIYISTDRNVTNLYPVIVKKINHLKIEKEQKII
jgi:hypothetical protein